LFRVSHVEATPLSLTCPSTTCFFFLIGRFLPSSRHRCGFHNPSFFAERAVRGLLSRLMLHVTSAHPLAASSESISRPMIFTLFSFGEVIRGFFEFLFATLLCQIVVSLFFFFGFQCRPFFFFFASRTSVLFFGWPDTFWLPGETDFSGFNPPFFLPRQPSPFSRTASFHCRSFYPFFIAYARVEMPFPFAARRGPGVSDFFSVLRYFPSSAPTFFHPLV